MDALIIGGVVALVTAALSAWAAWYGARANARPQQEGVAVTGLKLLTDEIQEERADLRQQLADVRRELAAERVRCAALETECATLRTRLAAGGTP